MVVGPAAAEMGRLWGRMSIEEWKELWKPAALAVASGAVVEIVGETPQVGRQIQQGKRVGGVSDYPGGSGRPRRRK